MVLRGNSKKVQDVISVFYFEIGPIVEKLWLLQFGLFMTNFEIFPENLNYIRYRKTVRYNFVLKISPKTLTFTICWKMKSLKVYAT